MSQLEIIEPEVVAESSPRIFRDLTDDSRVLALSVYASTASLVTASRFSGVPVTTIHGWVNSEEGASQVESLRIAARAHTAHKYVAAADVALEMTLERLVKGDPHVLKDGRIVYAPVKARDAAVIASIATDKTYLIAGALDGAAKVDRALRTLADRMTQAVTSAVQEGLAARSPVPPGDTPPDWAGVGEIG